LSDVLAFARAMQEALVEKSEEDENGDESKPADES